MDTKYVGIAKSFLTAGKPTLYHGGQILQYNNRHFEPVSLEEYGLFFRKWCDEQHIDCKRSTVAEVVETIMARMHTRHSKPMPFWRNEGPPAKNIIPFNNGLLNVETWELMPLTPDYVCHYCLPYDYEPAAKCPLWLKALGEVYEEDGGRIGLLQEWFGYCLVADISQHKLLGLVGVPRSCKSTILLILRRLVGDEHCMAFSLAAAATEFGLWSLMGKQVAIVSEVELEKHQHRATIVETLKRITGGDPVQINRKFLSSITTVLPTRFTFAANRMPLLFDGSQALADRVMLVEHKRSFLGREDRELLPKLEAEIEGVAVWALEGLKRLRANGRFTEVESDTRTRFYRMSAPTSAFLQDCCVVHLDFAPAHLSVQATTEKVTVGKDDLYRAYVDWCDKYGVFGKAYDGFHFDLAELMPLLSEHTFRPHGKPRCYRGLAVVKDLAA